MDFPIDFKRLFKAALSNSCNNTPFPLILKHLLGTGTFFKIMGGGERSFNIGGGDHGL